jgi:NADPH-dependent glutamate synthase beta subunit-like oxidoreductase
VLTKRAVGENDVTGLECVRVEWVDGKMQEVPGSEFTLKADLILLAMGFLGPRKQGLLEQAGVELDARGNVKGNVVDYKTSDEKCSPAATCGAGRAWSSGRSAKAARRAFGGRSADGRFRTAALIGGVFRDKTGRALRAGRPFPFRLGISGRCRTGPPTDRSRARGRRCRSRCR